MLALMLLIINFLLLFVSKDIAEKPFEDARITMNWDVDLVVLGYLLEAFVKILHVAYKERSRELKIFLLALVVIDDMYHNPIFSTDLTHFREQRATLKREFVCVRGGYVARCDLWWSLSGFWIRILYDMIIFLIFGNDCWFVDWCYI